jgi:hypothetical protein
MSRPEKWKDEYLRIVERACALGATDVDIADMLGVSVRTIYNWRQTKPELCEAMKGGKEAPDDRVERSLYQKAVGYTFDSVKIFQHQGEIIEAPYREHVPPDTTAAIFWLKNRRPDLWRDKQNHEITGKDGEPLVRANELAESLIAHVIAAKSQQG